ncbi:hypothetical protein PLUA15_240184 [Pseudomonas lundensis]|uniref:Uncharacterized protein n=1 Tax=Pseudomonas lundensis TaxID=86185 RepID=A0AAX2H7F6_9PSED|nr:hypothetical protein PLUA15_240184 [Pseudomonas lundensis]
MVSMHMRNHQRLDTFQAKIDVLLLAMNAGIGSFFISLKNATVNQQTGISVHHQLVA